MRQRKKIFVWQGMGARGERLKGEVTALTMNLARYQLLKKKIQLSFIQQKKRGFFTSRIVARDNILFFRQLATLLCSGIPITQAVIILTQNTKNEKLTAILSSIHENLNSGKNFTDALRKFPAHFDAVSCCLIEAGEKTGTLENMLDQVALYKEKIALLKNKLFQALFYPGMITLVAILTSIIMLTCIVPRFADLFLSMHSTLPAFTLAVIHLANFFQRYQFVFLFILCLSGVGIYYSQRYESSKKRVDACLLSLPLIGVQLQKFIFIRFSRGLATIFASGIPITEALNILMHCTGNQVFVDAIRQVYRDISTGKQLHVAMQRTAIFSNMMLQMIQVGEESGTLEKMLHKIADFYEGDIDHLITHLNKLLEPLIMIILGVLIGGLVIAMYLPIFKLGTVI